MINKEYLLNEYGMGGEELKIEDKMNTLDKAELKNFINYCAVARVFPSNTSLKGWIETVEKNRRLRDTAHWLAANNLFGDVYDVLNICQQIIDEHSNCDMEDYERHCMHCQTIARLENWFQEYLRK